jgi:hypothetical protein
MKIAAAGITALFFFCFGDRTSIREFPFSRRQCLTRVHYSCRLADARWQMDVAAADILRYPGKGEKSHHAACLEARFGCLDLGIQAPIKRLQNIRKNFAGTSNVIGCAICVSLSPPLLIVAKFSASKMPAIK